MLMRRPSSISATSMAVRRNHIQLAGYRASYDSAAVPQLIAKLESETNERRRACWASVLGLIGDETAVEALIAAIETPNLRGPAWLDSLSEEFRGLGCLVNRTGSARALTYLLDGLTSGAWRKRNVQQGSPPLFRSDADYDQQLSKLAVIALALSGDARAGDALRSMQSSPKPGQALVGKELDDMLASWLEVHQLVAERGLQGMYDYYDVRRRFPVASPQP